MFDLLGLQFSPWIKDLGGQRLYRADRDSEYQHKKIKISIPFAADFGFDSVVPNVRRLSLSPFDRDGCG